MTLNIILYYKEVESVNAYFLSVILAAIASLVFPPYLRSYEDERGEKHGSGYHS